MVFDAHDRGFALFKDVCTRGIYDRTSLAKDVGDFVFDGTPLKCAETDCGLIFIHGQFFRDAGVEEPRLHQRSSRPSRRKHFRMCLPMGRGQLPLGGAVPLPFPPSNVLMPVRDFDLDSLFIFRSHFCACDPESVQSEV
jgi:hypothetical protein